MFNPVIKKFFDKAKDFENKIMKKINLAIIWLFRKNGSTTY